MRPRVLALLLTLALLLVAGAWVIHEKGRSSSQPIAVSSQRIDNSKPAALAEADSLAGRQTSDAQAVTNIASVVNAPQPAAQDSTATNQESYTETRIAQLMDIAMIDDPGNLQTILSELTNRDPEIRKAARDAAVQFGSREAIPKLIEAANFTDDPKEKSEFTEAAEFLKLPSLTEISAQSARAQNSAAAAPGSKPFSPRAKTAAQAPASPK